MDKNDEVAKDVCTSIIQKGIRQERYRLKRDYFNDVTPEQALLRKPPGVTVENWRQLVTKWSDKRNKVCYATSK